MKKTLFIFVAILIVLLSTIFLKINDKMATENDVKKFNLYYTEHLNKNFFGSEVATIISKSIDNNEKYNISKDENDMYISDNAYSVKIYINIVGSKKIYEMETINKVGITQFISNFNTLEFTCVKINYHDSTKRVSEVYISEVSEK